MCACVDLSLVVLCPAGERHGVTEDLSGDVYLHPRSALRSQAPDLLMYTELVRRSDKVYMSGATNIQVRGMLVAHSFSMFEVCFLRCVPCWLQAQAQ
jgi:hypothetical protein